MLTLWRRKLQVSEHPQQIFDAVGDVVWLAGVIAGKHRRALDSTVPDDAGWCQDAITIITTQMRRIRKLVFAADELDPEPRHVHKTTHSYRDGHKSYVAVEPDTGLVTATYPGRANLGDAEAAPGLLEDGPPGTEVLGDSADSSDKLRARRHEVQWSRLRTRSSPPMTTTTERIRGGLRR